MLMVLDRSGAHSGECTGWTREEGANAMGKSTSANSTSANSVDEDVQVRIR
jgi:hypothetical protein